MAKKLNLQILILVGLECIKINKDLFYDLFKVGFFQPFLFFFSSYKYSLAISQITMPALTEILRECLLPN